MYFPSVDRLRCVLRARTPLRTREVRVFGTREKKPETMRAIGRQLSLNRKILLRYEICHFWLRFFASAACATTPAKNAGRFCSHTRQRVRTMRRDPVPGQGEEADARRE